MPAHRSILTVMTPFPVVLDAQQTLGDARDLMGRHAIRHLPVEAGGTCVAVISARDLDLASSLGAEPTTPVSDVRFGDTLVVEASESIAGCVRKMVDAGARAAVVSRNGRLAGIVTWSDVGALLLEVLGAPPPTRGGGIA